MPIEPDPTQSAETAAGAGGDADGPVVMLNLNRYRDRAAYGDGPPDRGAELSGREAYAGYGEVAMAVLGRLGGKILWHADARETVIGDEGDRYDEVIAVWYPSRAAFLALASHDDVVAVLAHRRAGLERATLICCESGPEPVLAGP